MATAGIRTPLAAIPRNTCQPSARWRRTLGAGRDPASLPVTIGGAPNDLDKLKRFRDLGAARVNISLMSDARDEILLILDKWAGYIHQLRS
jgi:hypothetical protein